MGVGRIDVDGVHSFFLGLRRRKVNVLEPFELSRRAVCREPHIALVRASRRVSDPHCCFHRKESCTNMRASFSCTCHAGTVGSDDTAIQVNQEPNF